MIHTRVPTHGEESTPVLFLKAFPRGAHPDRLAPPSLLRGEGRSMVRRGLFGKKGGVENESQGWQHEP